MTVPASPAGDTGGQTMSIRCGYQIELEFPQPTAMVAMLAVRDDQPTVKLLSQTHRNSRSLPVSEYRDGVGNRCHRLLAPAGPLILEGDSVVRCDAAPDAVYADAGEVPVADLPAECLVYLMGSRYCETDKLSEFAASRFGNTPPGWGRVQAITDFVQQHVKFGYKHADSTRTAFETLNGQIGVCRDFAHLAIALCRCLNIPARYVNGHLGDIGVPVVDPMDFSAWMEVYLDGGWHAFDPRNNARRIGRIVVAYGRDAADVPLLNTFGAHTLTKFRVWTYEVP